MRDVKTTSGDQNSRVVIAYSVDDDAVAVIEVFYGGRDFDVINLGCVIAHPKRDVIH